MEHETCFIYEVKTLFPRHPLDPLSFEPLNSIQKKLEYK